MTPSGGHADASRHPPEFEGFPFLVTRVGHTPLRHIALLPADWSFDRLAEAVRRQARANRLDTCLCLGPTERPVRRRRRNRVCKQPPVLGDPGHRRHRASRAARLDARTPRPAGGARGFRPAQPGQRLSRGRRARRGPAGHAGGGEATLGPGRGRHPSRTPPMRQVRRVPGGLPRGSWRGKWRHDPAGRPRPLPLRESQPVCPLRRAPGRMAALFLLLRGGRPGRPVPCSLRRPWPPVRAWPLICRRGCRPVGFRIPVSTVGFPAWSHPSSPWLSGMEIPGFSEHPGWGNCERLRTAQG